MAKINSMSDLIAQVESSGNQFAIKFEPAWSYTTPANIQRCADKMKCNEVTAKNLLCNSWGLFQIMGSVLYDLSSPGYEPNLFAYLNSLTTQGDYFMHFNAKYCGGVTLEEFLTDKERAFEFCHRYNGDIDAYYARCMQVYNDNMAPVS